MQGKETVRCPSFAMQTLLHTSQDGETWREIYLVGLRRSLVRYYEETLKALKAGFEKGPNRAAGLVSQSAAGTPTGTYYVSTFAKSLADYDPVPNAPPLREILGERGYATYMKSTSDDVISSEWDIARLLPELRNPQ